MLNGQFGSMSVDLICEQNGKFWLNYAYGNTCLVFVIGVSFGHIGCVNIYLIDLAC